MPDDITLITQLPSNGWYESFVPRPNGHFLVARVDKGELYDVDHQNPDSPPELLYKFDESITNGIIDLCAVPGHDDEYILLTGIVDLAAAKAGDFITWRIRLSKNGKQAPVVTELAHLPEAALVIGVAAFSPRYLLVCDSARGCLWQVDVQTGKASILISDEDFTTISEEHYFGICAIHIVDNYVWFTNSSRASLGRVPLRLEKAQSQLAVDGEIEILSTEIEACDGLTVSPDSSVAYTGCLPSGCVWKVEIFPDGSTKTSKAVENLVYPTDTHVVKENGKHKLYVLCVGETELPWSDGDEWKDLAGINESVTIEVTTEVIGEGAESHETIGYSGRAYS
ncbi:hypothetical protein SCUP515_08276 [Seiridium cupressi]